MGEFILTVKFTVDITNREKFKEELQKLFSQIKKDEKDFVKAYLHENLHKEEEFLVYEVWNNMTFENFMNVQLKKDYALEWEKLMIEMNVKREPNVYQILE